MSPSITKPPPSYKPVNRAPGTPPPLEDLEGEGHDLRMSFFEHLDELRRRLFKALLALIVGTGVGIALAGPALEYLIRPYGDQLQALGPTEPVVAYFRVALMIGGALAMPVITYQLLMFILPGLTSRERRILLSALPAIMLLFAVGAAFAWFLLVPPALNFLGTFQEQIFVAEWTADLYLGFITSLIFWMGVAFETPLVFFVLALIGLVAPAALIRNWRIAIIGAVVAAAIITPTVDPVNMFLVTAPLLVLYLLSIVLVAAGNRLNRPR